jgi:hypothetical protein
MSVLYFKRTVSPGGPSGSKSLNALRHLELTMKKLLLCILIGASLSAYAEDEEKVRGSALLKEPTTADKLAEITLAWKADIVGLRQGKGGYILKPGQTLEDADKANKKAWEEENEWMDNHLFPRNPYLPYKGVDVVGSQEDLEAIAKSEYVKGFVFAKEGQFNAPLPKPEPGDPGPNPLFDYFNNVKRSKQQ